MHITKRAIIGFDLKPDHPNMVKLSPQQRLYLLADRRGEEIQKAADYMYKSFKKVKGNGCVLGAHHYG